MILFEAQRLATDLVNQMHGCCERIEIAGSIRRRKPEVTDIEIVCIPRWENLPDPTDLFGERTIHTNLLHQWALSSGIRWIHKNDGQVHDATIKNDGKMWKGLLPCGAQLDLFLTTPKSWGVIFLIRTGSAEFSQAVVTHAKYHGKPVKNGRLTMSGVPVETPEEEDVFRLLGLEYVEPSKRIDNFAVREAGRAAIYPSGEPVVNALEECL